MIVFFGVECTCELPQWPFYLYTGNKEACFLQGPYFSFLVPFCFVSVFSSFPPAPSAVYGSPYLIYKQSDEDEQHDNNMAHGHTYLYRLYFLSTGFSSS